MPHLHERPVSLVRAPDGFSGELFFQKHFDQVLPTGLKALDPALHPDHAPMVTVADRSGLIASAQWNVVEFHTANARATHIKCPDRLIFDLDPGDKVSWDQVRQGTELVHELLRELDLLCFAKTSGGRGIHIVVPIKREYTWTVAKDFSRAVVTHLARILPTLFVAKSGPKNRVGKIFVDYLRNGSVATTVCAWSARARPGAGVSVPIAWDELSAVKAANEWSVQNIRSRLDTGNSPWDGYDKVANELTSAMRRLNYRRRIEREVR